MSIKIYFILGIVMAIILLTESCVSKTPGCKNAGEVVSITHIFYINLHYTVKNRELIWSDYGFYSNP